MSRYDALQIIVTSYIVVYGEPVSIVFLDAFPRGAGHSLKTKQVLWATNLITICLFPRLV